MYKANIGWVYSSIPLHNSFCYKFNNSEYTYKRGETGLKYLQFQNVYLVYFYAELCTLY
jgi:hypothetical protein